MKHNLKDIIDYIDKVEANDYEILDAEPYSVMNKIITMLYDIQTELQQIKQRKHFRILQPEPFYDGQLALIDEILGENQK